MQFSHLNKAVAALVAAVLAILSLVFKQDLGQYAEVTTGLIAAMTPIAVYLIPNFAKDLADGGKDQAAEDITATAAAGLAVNAVAK